MASIETAVHRKNRTLTIKSLPDANNRMLQNASAKNQAAQIKTKARMKEPVTSSAADIPNRFAKEKPQVHCMIRTAAQKDAAMMITRRSQRNFRMELFCSKKIWLSE